MSQNPAGTLELHFTTLKGDFKGLRQTKMSGKDRAALKMWLRQTARRNFHSSTTFGPVLTEAPTSFDLSITSPCFLCCRVPCEKKLRKPQNLKADCALISPPHRNISVTVWWWDFSCSPPQKKKLHRLVGCSLHASPPHNVTQGLLQQQSGEGRHPPWRKKMHQLSVLI